MEPTSLPPFVQHPAFLLSTGLSIGFLIGHFSSPNRAKSPKWSLPLPKSLATSALALLQGEVVTPDPAGIPGFLTLPTTGVSSREITRICQELAERDFGRYETGKVSGTVYLPGKATLGDFAEEHLKVLQVAGNAFTLANPLHPETFPSTRKFEAEIIAMVGNLLGRGAASNPAAKEVTGSVTTGGTESIVLAMKTYRDRARDRDGVGPDGCSAREPYQIVASVATHPAFDKAAQYFGMEVVHTPTDPKTGAADVAAMAAAITERTIVLVGCAPSYPAGIVDDIPTIAGLAKSRGLACHVDACLGGLLLPFVRRLGTVESEAIPPFDFSIPGVTSMSADTHKFGYATKGTSVVLYLNSELRRYQYFRFTSWPGGPYASPSICGSRPGSLIAACWASLVHLGDAGFMHLAQKVQETAVTMVQGLRAMEGVEVLGEPLTMTFAFTTTRESGVNVHVLSSLLKKRGWHLCGLQSPDALHFCISARNIGTQDEFLRDVRECMQQAKDQGGAGAAVGAALYGISGAMPEALKGAMVSEIADAFLDLLTDTSHVRQEGEDK